MKPTSVSHDARSHDVNHTTHVPGMVHADVRANIVGCEGGSDAARGPCTQRAAHRALPRTGWRAPTSSGRHAAHHSGGPPRQPPAAGQPPHPASPRLLTTPISRPQPSIASRFPGRHPAGFPRGMRSIHPHKWHLCGWIERIPGGRSGSVERRRRGLASGRGQAQTLPSFCVVLS